MNLRPIKPISMAGITKAKISTDLPRMEWVKPDKLFIEDSYQRNLSERSITMIRDMVRLFDWASMKPPICAKLSDGKLVVIDGQHTAIAIVSHGSIEKIPVIIVKADNLKNRAQAFVNHNSNRLAITRVQMFFASLTAGDEVSVAVAEACEKNRVTIRKNNPSCGNWNDRETISVGVLTAIAKKKGVAGLTRVLKIVISARRKPIVALELRALEYLLWGFGKLDVTDYEISTNLMQKSVQEWAVFTQKEGRKRKIPAFKVLAEYLGK